MYNCGKLEKLNILFLQIWPVRLESVPFLFGKIIHPLVKYWHKKLLKITCFFDKGLSLLESLFEVIPSLHFVQETLQKSAFVVNGEKPIWETQEVMIEFRIVLNLRNKTFHISNTGTKSISHSFHNLTNNIYVTANNNSKKS